MNRVLVRSYRLLKGRREQYTTFILRCAVVEFIGTTVALPPDEVVLGIVGPSSAGGGGRGDEKSEEDEHVN